MTSLTDFPVINMLSFRFQSFARDMSTDEMKFNVTGASLEELNDFVKNLPKSFKCSIDGDSTHREITVLRKQDQSTPILHTVDTVTKDVFRSRISVNA